MFCIPNDICGNICIISVSRHRLLPWRNMVNQFGADFTSCNLNVLVFAVSSTLANTCTTARACTCTHTADLCSVFFAQSCSRRSFVELRRKDFEHDDTICGCHGICMSLIYFSCLIALAKYNTE